MAFLPNPANLSSSHQWRPHFLYPQLSHTLTSPLHTTTTTTLPLSLHSPLSNSPFLQNPSSLPSKLPAAAPSPPPPPDSTA
ncbi:hypothetical protein LguiB_028675 [Lonicera macranthoides]